MLAAVAFTTMTVVTILALIGHTIWNGQKSSFFVGIDCLSLCSLSECKLHEN